MAEVETVKKFKRPRMPNSRASSLDNVTIERKNKQLNQATKQLEEKVKSLQERSKTRSLPRVSKVKSAQKKRQ